jgi:hypothetical protein
VKNTVKTGRARAAAKAKKKMPETVEYNDLCSTCNYGPECVRRKHHNQPVLYCEEFDDYQRAHRQPARGFGEYEPKEMTDLSRLSSARTMGLCAFCENQGICANTAKNVGVWHCEEYC